MQSSFQNNLVGFVLGMRRYAQARFPLVIANKQRRLFFDNLTRRVFDRVTASDDNYLYEGGVLYEFTGDCGSLERKIFTYYTAMCICSALWRDTVLIDLNTISPVASCLPTHDKGRLLVFAAWDVNRYLKKNGPDFINSINERRDCFFILGTGDAQVIVQSLEKYDRLHFQKVATPPLPFSY